MFSCFKLGLGNWVATYWENSCPFRLQCVFMVQEPGCWFVFFLSRFLDWKSFFLFLIAHFPDLCVLVPFYLQIDPPCGTHMCIHCVVLNEC